MVRSVLIGIAAALMAFAISTPSVARDGDEDNTPQFVPLNPDDIDISDVEIFGQDSGPVYGEQLETRGVSASPVVRPDEEPQNVFVLTEHPMLDVRDARDVRDVEIYDPTTDETTEERVATVDVDEAVEEAERDLYAEAEALFQSLHENDIDISGVEIFQLDSEPPEPPAPPSQSPSQPPQQEMAAEENAPDVQSTPSLRPNEPLPDDVEVAVVAPSTRPSLPPGTNITDGPVLRPDEEIPTVVVESVRPDHIDLADVEIFNPDSEPEQSIELANEDPKAEEVEARERVAEMFDSPEIEASDEDNSSAEYEMASLRDPSGPVPNVIDRSVTGSTDRHNNFDSRAFPGQYAGVGVAGGMRLELETNGTDVHGWLVDSAGQVFTVGGEIATLDGRAQAAVVSDSAAIGYLDLQLTNLGLGALYVPLNEDLTPVVDEARRYEFLRALSSEAQAALAMERAERLEILASQPDRDPRRRRVIWQEENDVFE